MDTCKDYLRNGCPSWNVNAWERNMICTVRMLRRCLISGYIIYNRRRYKTTLWIDKAVDARSLQSILRQTCRCCWQREFQQTHRRHHQEKLWSRYPFFNLCRNSSVPKCLKKMCLIGFWWKCGVREAINLLPFRGRDWWSKILSDQGLAAYKTTPRRVSLILQWFSSNYESCAFWGCYVPYLQVN